MLIQIFAYLPQTDIIEVQDTLGLEPLIIPLLHALPGVVRCRCYKILVFPDAYVIGVCVFCGL